LAVDDLLRLDLGLARPALIVGEQRLRLLAQLACLVELVADRLGALVERRGYLPGTFR